MSKLFSFSNSDNYMVLRIFGIKIFSRYTRLNNHIYVVDEFGNKKKVKRIPGLDIKFRASDSSVTVYKPFINMKGSTIRLGANCHVSIKNKKEDMINGLNDVYMDIYQNSNLSIGENFYNAHSYYLMFNSSVEIGDDCMFSHYINIIGGDSHKIWDKDTKEVFTDKPGNLVIGNHVWIGMHSTILRNAKIPDGSIVGASSVVAGKFDTPNVVIAGNPAKVVKQNVEWEK